MNTGLIYLKIIIILIIIYSVNKIFFVNEVKVSRKFWKSFSDDWKNI